MPGLQKSRMHFRLPDHHDFADFLLDLYGAMQFGFNPPIPMLHIMDAIWIQEGEGPGPAGKKRAMNAIVVGENGIAVDYVATRVAGLDVHKVYTIVNGFARNYGVASPEEIEVIGDTIDALALAGVEPATGSSVLSNMFRWPLTTKIFKNLFLERPVPRADKCTLCYQCRTICPAGAISASLDKQKAKVPLYNYRECIRCYCCLEICPEAAIEKKRGKLQWMMGC